MSSPGRNNEGEIHVAEIVVHRPAARQAPDHANPFFLHIGQIDLADRVLVLADNDGVIVTPEHEVIMLPAQVVKDKLLQRQVEARVIRIVFNVVHHGRQLLR